ncbi:MAG: VanZ family protein, partial [Methanobacteriota archaeon]
MINPIKWLEDHPKLAGNLAVFYAGIIFLISQTPTIPAPPGPDYMMYILHFLEYAGLGALLLIAVKSRRYGGSAITLAIVLGIFYGISDEIHQHFVA